MPSFPALPADYNTVAKGVPPRSNGEQPSPADLTAAAPSAQGVPAAASARQVGAAPNASIGGDTKASIPAVPPAAEAQRATPVDLYPGMSVPARYRSTPFDQLPAVMQAKLSREVRPSP